MYVDIDEIWFTPSNFHCRVIVWGDDGKWRRKFYQAIPLEEMIDAAGAEVLAHLALDGPEEDHHQTALF